MRSSPIRILALTIVAASLVAGCSRREADLRTSTPTADTLANGLRRDVVPKLAPWLELWQTAIPGLVADSMRSGGTGPALRGGTTQPLGDFESLSPGESAAFEALTARSPDGRHRLIFDRYQTISEEEDGAVDISGEPDSAPLLIDERLRRVHIFEFCGTPCGYDWGCWVDSVRFALGGWAEVDGTRESSRGTLDVYSLRDSTVVRYFTRPVTADEYANYREAWRDWVTRRYREQQAQATRPEG